MSKFKKIFALFSFLIVGIASFGIISRNNQPTNKVEATEVTSYYNGNSGEVFYVNGNSKYFNTGEADLAVYFYSSTYPERTAWANKDFVHRLYADVFIVPTPYINGQSVKFTHLIICRYDINKNPAVNGFDGVLNQSDNISIADFVVNSGYIARNTISVNGYQDNSHLACGYYLSKQNGIKSDSHIYLDLSDFTEWEEGGAKFAIYFAYPNTRAENAKWCVAYNNDHSGYTSAFCWKVKGQDNEHLYECIVPRLDGISGNNFNIWSMVIAVRLNPNCDEPNWDSKWNQTQDLGINSLNTNSNIIKVTGWNEGTFLENNISDADRANFYGNYFLDNVTCSGGEYDATSEAMWQSVQDEYMMHLSTTVEGEIWKSTIDNDGTLVQKAMARYDYIVFYKQYDHPDFINRVESTGRGYINESRSVRANTNEGIEILVVSLISTAVLAGLLVTIKIKLKKKMR